MKPDYLHHHSEFKSLLSIVAGEMQIEPYLVEKDYWIMHVLNGLQKQGLEFYLKGGTSLSKGYGIIERFSEDIDIYIRPLKDLGVDENPRHTKLHQVETRKAFYDMLVELIKILGIVSVERDHAFDDTDYYRSGGIRLQYMSLFPAIRGIKEGILLEVGFDIIAPNSPLTISSWAYDIATQTSGVHIIDNRAFDIPCYHPGYTFVEKMQTIATKYRQEIESGEEKQNFMRQYYDMSRLLLNATVEQFIGTREYHEHKVKRFPRQDQEIPIAANEAFLLSDPITRARFKDRYQSTASLYYTGQPDFDEVLSIIHSQIAKL